MIKHWTQPRGQVLRVVVELDLGEALAHLGPREEQYRARVHQYLERVEHDVFDVLRIVEQAPEHGIVKWFNESLGYGFIRGYDRQDVFVHHKQIVGDGFKSLAKGQAVTFKRRMGRETFEAIDVHPEGDKE